MKRTVLLVVAALLLVGAGSLGGHLGFTVSQAQKIRNFEAWQGLTETQRRDLRQSWESVAALPDEAQDDIFRRHGALVRMRLDYARAHGSQPGPEELALELEGLAPRVAQRLGLESAEAQTVPGLVDARIAQALSAFLDNLQASGDIGASAREWLESLPADDLVAECLKQQKRQDIFLFVERHAPEGQEELMELQELDPLEVIDRLDAHRRSKGFLGRAGKSLQLTDEQLAELAASPEKDALRLLKRMLKPRIVELLETTGKPAERIDQILRLPPRELERVLNRLLREAQ